MNGKIPFLDLVTPHQELKDELMAVMSRALETAGFIGGFMVEEFEKDFAAFCGAKHCIAVNSGTDALRFAFIAGGVKTGDIVVSVPNTFIATAEAISQAGATPVFVDVDERTYNLDPRKLREFLETSCRFDSAKRRTIHTKTGKPVTGVVPVHLYGQTADMDAIGEIAAQYNLHVFEDACQAHGAQYYSRKGQQWRKAGTMGVASGFSFYPGKNLGACGEGGAITTDDERIAKTCRMLRDHGQVQKYYHDVEGYNGRLDAIQCGMLQVKLRRLPKWTEQRRAAAKHYNELLQSIPGITPPFEPEWSKAVYHLYVVRTPNRGRLQKRLADQEIASGLHYPVPLHLQKAYADRGYQEGDFPVAEKAANEILSLPIYPGLTEGQIRRVAQSIKGA